MRPVLASLAVGAGLVLAYHFVLRAPSLGSLALILELGSSFVVGLTFAGIAARSHPRWRLPHLVAGGAAAGMVVMTAQFSLLLPSLAILVAPAIGGLFGVLGSALYICLERGARAKRDPARDTRYRRTIARHAEPRPQRAPGEDPRGPADLSRRCGEATCPPPTYEPAGPNAHLAGRT